MIFFIVFAYRCVWGVGVGVGMCVFSCSHVWVHVCGRQLFYFSQCVCATSCMWTLEHVRCIHVCVYVYNYVCDFHCNSTLHSFLETRVLCILSYPQIHYDPKADLELLIFLPIPFKCWDFRNVPPVLALFIQYCRLPPRALCLCIKWASFPTWLRHFFFYFP